MSEYSYFGNGVTICYTVSNNLRRIQQKVVYDELDLHDTVNDYCIFMDEDIAGPSFPLQYLLSISSESSDFILQLTIFGTKYRDIATRKINKRIERKKDALVLCSNDYDPEDIDMDTDEGLGYCLSDILNILAMPVQEYLMIFEQEEQYDGILYNSHNSSPIIL